LLRSSAAATVPALGNLLAANGTAIAATAMASEQQTNMPTLDRRRGTDAASGIRVGSSERGTPPSSTVDGAVGDVLSAALGRGGGHPARSYYMIGIVLVDRTATTFRTLAVAAIAVLLLAPEAVVHPSFQMSFAERLRNYWWVFRRPLVHRTPGHRSCSCRPCATGQILIAFAKSVSPHS
jgi:hypothetical protein